MRRGDRRRAGRSALEAFTRALEAERPRWLVPVVLAVPFLVVIAAARGLTVTVPTFHGGDETVYHYPTIVRFAHQWPGIDLVHYPAAQTPLLHVVMATLSQLVGLEVWRLRLLDALISYGAALVLYRMLRRRRRLEPPAALALTSLVVISPYVFAESFLLLTDNAALGLIIVTLDQLERFRERPRVVPFALAALAACAAVLTRQSAGFVFVVVCGYLLLSWRAIDWPARLVSLGLPVLAALPMALLALAWGGFVPIGADTSSCGLCATAAGRVDQAGAGLFLRSVSFTLAVVGVYAIVLFAPALVAGMRRRAPGGALGAVVGRPLVRARLRLALRLAAAGAAVAVVLLVVEPLRGHVGDAGWLWRVADHAPVLLGNAGVFWILVPVGAAALVVRWRAAPRDWLGPLFLGAFLLVALSTRLGYQKYYDPYALLALVLTVRPRELGRWNYLGIAVLMIGSIAYALSFVVGLNHAVTAPGR